MEEEQMSMGSMKFRDLEYGQIFMFKDSEDIFLRIPYFVDSSSSRGEVNIYNLSQNTFGFALPIDVVIPLKTELVIH